MPTRTRCPRPSITLIAFVGVSSFVATLALAVQPDAVQRQRLAQIRVPFVENSGQWDDRVAFAAKTGFGEFFVTSDGQLVYSLPGQTENWTLRETFVSGKPIPRPLDPAVTRVSYFRGKNADRWQRGLPSYQEVGLGKVWQGISVTLRARDNTVEKIFTLAPGASVGKIRLRVDGARSLHIDSDGSLLASHDSGRAVRFTAPAAYQEWEGIRRPVAAEYAVHGSKYGLRLGVHDPSLPVLIDPILQATYLGGSGRSPINGEGDQIHALAIDPPTGDVLVAGWTYSYDFPGMSGGADETNGGGLDAFVARLDSTLTTLIQATYLGGNGGELAYGMSLEPSTGDVFVAGYTSSPDFPGTAGGAQQSLNGIADGFVARLNSSLTSLLQATYLGGSDGQYGTLDTIRAIAVSPSTEEILVSGTTNSTDFPGTAGGAQPTFGGGWEDGFVARLDPTLTMLLQATYLGGTGRDWLNAIAVDPPTGDVVVAGTSGSTNVARLNSTLTSLIQATHFGGSGDDEIYAISVRSPGGDVYIGGYTTSTDLPGTNGGAQPTYGGSWADGFVARFDPTLTRLLQATYLGGYEPDWVEAIAVDPTTGNIFVSGTSSSNLPGRVGGAQPACGGESDGFVARFAPTLTTLLQTTYVGGSDMDEIHAVSTNSSTGDVYVGGYTQSPDFPAAAGGAQPSLNDYGDGFIARLTPDLLALLAPFSLIVDPSTLTPGDGNSIFEPGEVVAVIPSWKNQSSGPLSPSGLASEFSGPPYPSIYTIVEDTVSYGAIAPGAAGTAFGNYQLSISVPDVRPALHWDASLVETLDVPYVLPYRWVLHVGDSFPDVPRSSLFYPYIENILHHGITAGCGGGNYCAASSVTRAQMAVFLLKAEHGQYYAPPYCTGIFADVPCTWGTGFADWIEQLFHEGITSGCSGGNYCPNDPVTRAQMAAFLLKAEHGSTYLPPVCNGMFADVTCPSLFADWIEQLAAEGITGGCGGGNYCPYSPNTRGQMAVFLVKTFGLTLYGP